MARKPHDEYMRATESVNPSPEPETGTEGRDGGDVFVPENLDALCRLHVCPACPVRAEAEESRLRALAETENTKKRLQREQEEALRFAAEHIMGDLLPTLDTLDLALQYGTQREACKDVIQGVEMTRKLMLDALRRHGLETLGERGDAFTPECHEAMGFEKDEALEEGRVCALLQRGYRLKERLLRPAKVMIVKNAS
jgi:molecular chaperone GrpE